jgi:hypothetical protein
MLNPAPFARLLALPHAEYVLSTSYHSYLRPRWIEPELYQNWAVEALCADYDTPSLRKLPTDTELYEFERDVRGMLCELDIAAPDEQACIRLLFVFYAKLILLYHSEGASVGVIFADLELLSQRTEKGEFLDFLHFVYSTIGRRSNTWRAIARRAAEVCTVFLSTTRVEIVRSAAAVLTGTGTSPGTDYVLQVTTDPAFYTSYDALVPRRKSPRPPESADSSAS